MTEALEFKLPFNLQFFAEDGDESDQTDDTSGDDKDTQNNDDNQNTDNDKSGDKTFTQKDVNNIVTKESRKATENLLRDVGITDFENAKEGLKQFKEWQDSQKTDQEKQEQNIKTLTDSNKTLTDENTSLKAEISAMKQNVNPEYVEDVIALAERQVTDDVSIDDAIKTVVEKYPHFSKESSDKKQDEDKPRFINGESSKPGGNGGEDDPFEAINQKYKR